MLAAPQVKRYPAFATIAQLVELLICNQMVGGSSPSCGSTQSGAQVSHSCQKSGGAKVGKEKQGGSLATALFLFIFDHNL